MKRTVDYINRQAEHHKKRDFKTEFVSFLDAHFIEYDLRDASAIAEIDEHATAVIAARPDPAKQHNGASAVAGAQRATVVGSLQINEEL